MSNFTVDVTSEEMKLVMSNDLYVKEFCEFCIALANDDKEQIKNIIKFTHGTELNKVLISIKRKNKGEK